MKPINFWTAVSAVVAVGCSETAQLPSLTATEADLARLHLVPVYEVGLGSYVEEQFSDVRAARILPDGGLAVAEASTQDIRIFDEAGLPAGTWLGRGEGPGEATGLNGLFRVEGEGFLVDDLTLRRRTILESDGSLARSGTGARIQNVVGMWSSTEVIAYRDFSLEPGTSFWIRIEDLEGVALDSVGPFPARLEFTVSEGRSQAGVDYPLRPVVKVAAYSGLMVIGGTMGDSLLLLTADRDSLTLRTPASGHPVDDSFVERWMNDVVPEPSALRRATFAAIEEVGIPEVSPVIEDVLLEPSRNIWVREFGLTAAGSQRWFRFSEETGWGEVVLPPGRRRVLDVAFDRLVSLRWNALGVPVLEVFAVRPSGTEG